MCNTDSGHFFYLELVQLFFHVALTKCFEELSRCKLSIEENGAVVDVESSAHAYEEDLQTT